MDVFYIFYYLCSLCIWLAGNIVSQSIYFNGSTSLTLPSQDILQGFSFSFRTCFGGTLLLAKDNFRIDLQPSNNITHSEIDLRWNNNGTWHNAKLSLKFSVDRNSLYLIELKKSNQSYQFGISGKFNSNINISQSISNTILSSNLTIGNDFNGCLSSGNRIDINNANPKLPCPLDSGLPCAIQDCPAGFTGRSCEANIDDCGSIPCHHFSKCIDGINSFTCQCGPRWTGHDCSTFLGSICDNTTCFNGGSCVDSFDKNNYTCECIPPYGGRHCEVMSFPCTSQPCLNNGTCSNVTLDTFSCSCVDGFAGAACELNKDDCASFPCGHGSCIDGINSFICNCSGSGFKGDRCQTDVMECTDLLPCQNNATCVEKYGSYSCVCLPGFTGQDCQVNINECMPEPCLNNGNCTDLINGYNCSCMAGFHGTNCEINIDECALNQCNATGTQKCDDGINDFVCVCLPGYTGRNCEIELDECQVRPCLNSATCIDVIAGYSCQCSAGFTGVNCEVNIDDCALDSICNNGTCLDGVASFTCNCDIGYTGKRCGIDIDDCAGKPCSNDGSCQDLVNDFKCNCLPAYTGSLCETWKDPCLPDLCLNNATCSNATGGMFFCNCSDTGYGGDLCQHQLGNCWPNPCLHGTCNDLGVSYNCTCDDGYKGFNCSEDINECEIEKPCLNNGTCQNLNGTFMCHCNALTTGRLCQDDVDECLDNELNKCWRNRTELCLNKITTGYRCVCYQGFYGDFCERQINECAQSGRICSNGGTCVNLPGLTTSCQCVEGFTGKDCEIDIDDCEQKFCQNNSTCQDLIADYNCTCLPGFKGKNCSINIDECAPNPCHHNSTCIDGINQFTCNCSLGYNGTTCEEDIDWCVFLPCQNGGNCTDGIETHNCSCYNGYFGHNCEIDINECEGQPCQNNGMCIEKSNHTALQEAGILGINETLPFVNRDGYLCVCANGFNGTNCTNDIDECQSMPCQNNATCNDLIGDYNCTCMNGYTGRNCSEDINECEPMPCKNNATCIDMIGLFKCNCTSLFMGTTCETPINICTTQMPCQNNATCIPLPNNYQCECLPGYSGSNCQYSTNLNFKGNGNWFVPFSGSQINITLEFRTTLANTYILDLYQENSPSNISLFIKNGILSVSTSQNDSTAISSFPVNDMKWNQLNFIISNTELRVRYLRKDCLLGRCNEVMVSRSTLFVFDAIEFGSLKRSSPFIGCMRNVYLNTSVLIPELSNGTLSNVTFGKCLRSEVCNPNSCSKHGVCNDFWYFSNCTCQRQYFGEICEHEILPFSFGLPVSPTIDINATLARKRRSIASSANINNVVTSDMSFLFTDSTTISFLLRTRHSCGIIIFLSSNGHALPSKSLEIVNGVLNLIQSNGNQTTQLPLTGVTINDGKLHIIQWTENKITVDDIAISLNDTQQLDLIVQIIYLGGVKNISLYQNAIITNNCSFIGCLQDVRVGNVLLSSQPILPPNTTTNDVDVSPGVGSTCNGTNVCDSNPCQFNGVCNDQWNEYNCTCAVGFAGKNCTDYGCKVFNRCNSTGDCADIPNKPGAVQCMSPVTFNGANSSVTFSYPTNVTLNNKTSISFKIRTRSYNVTLLAVHNSSIDSYELAIEMGVLKMSIKTNTDDVNLEIAETISEGLWHDVEFTISNQIVTLTLDNLHSDSRSLQSSYQSFKQLALDNGLQFGNYKNAFKGCMKHWVVDDSFLLLNNSTKQNEISTGCQSDKVCLQNPCNNNGVCIDDFNDFLCQCPSHFTGRNCELRVNVSCSINETLCWNNGSCLTLSNPLLRDNLTLSDIGYDHFRCNCANGYEGRRCLNTTNECKPDPCLNGAICNDLFLDYNCSCALGYKGKNCSIDLNECESNPCLNNATCLDAIGNYTCNCTEGFFGRHCEVDIDECDLYSPCQNNATCLNIYGGYNCTCLNKDFGKNCEYNASMACISNPCMNSGNCTANSTGYTCSCQNGYTGIDCESDLHDCLSSPCHNNATCLDSHSQNITISSLIPGFNCTCLDGFNGDLCDGEINPCDNTPCLNNGTCIKETFTEFKCNCTTAYHGNDCSIKRTACDDQSCSENGICVLNSTLTSFDPNGFYCNCTEGYYGDDCENNSDPCPTCVNSESCTPFLEDCNNCRNPKYFDFNCTCKSGYTGKLCHLNDPCEPDNPCLNGRLCNLLTNFTNGNNMTDFNCSCPTDSGLTCNDGGSGGGGVNAALIVGVSFGGTILLVILIIVICILKSKFGMHGTYSPSGQEKTGVVEMNSIMKPPPKERLI